MNVTLRVLRKGDDAVLQRVAEGVFDNAVSEKLAAEFLGDSRHHLIVALDDIVVVGMISAVHYVHPDKPAELWINEVGVAPTHQRQGIAQRMLAEMLEVGRRIGCVNAWVLTDRSNDAAMRLYGAMKGVGAPNDSVMFEFDLRAQE